ncbi:WD40 repeat domain-containing protein [Catellatospora methionotrophica]|uniref:WD40 repeat domain-containing protein n=1 Tax=Catellatospora methionotrophica TaxID=121620 RepID=UPI0033CD934D
MDSTLRELLAAAPSAEAWREVCRLLADAGPQDMLAAVSHLRTWPADLRPMPDGWWDERGRGVHRPWHAAAAWRALGDLADVQNGRPPAAGTDDDDETDFACFAEGATAVAVPADPSWLLLCAAAEWHHNGGDIVVWGTGGHTAPAMLLDGSGFHDEALDAQLSPDGTVAVCSVEGRLHAWRVPGGEPLWQLALAETTDPADGDMAHTAVRIGFSGDGRRVVAGSAARGVHLVDTGTGELLHHVRAAPCGPVALDRDGGRLAHAGGAGGIVVRDAATGTVLLCHDTGLAAVNALAFAPDGTGLAVAGGLPETGGSRHVRPAACVLDLARNTVTGTRLVVPSGVPAKLAADSPLAAVSTRCVWGVHGPLVNAVDDAGAVLFDATGQVLWTAPEMTVGGFSADGRVLVTVGEDVTAVLLDGLVTPR